MHYIDSQRTLTRRDSSLLVGKRDYTFGLDKNEGTYIAAPAGKILSECHMTSETTRPCGSVRRELITMMFESMLSSVVESWVQIPPPKVEEVPLAKPDLGRSASETSTYPGKRRKSVNTMIKPSARSKRSRSIIEELENSPDPLLKCWWSSPDERAIIHFKNGNLYEGGISMKCMHGEGRFQWTDGTVYLGQFHYNEIKGKGTIQWKDDTWYQGLFAGNLRHGEGLYVDSRKQRSYMGGWHCGAKHGQGIIYYSSFQNSYDGDWIQNVRHGYGVREYCSLSGYKGEWDRYTREGQGMMIWPNHDFYHGGWKNGVMSGYGIYIWDFECKHSMSLPSLTAFRGLWEKGQREGYGFLNLGQSLGAHYKGEFKKNKKHGPGKFVTNNGLILQSKKLFTDDNLSPEGDDNLQLDVKAHIEEPLRFDICDDTVGLMYHVVKAFKNIDKDDEIKNEMINDFFELNSKFIECDVSIKTCKDVADVNNSKRLEDLIEFEEMSLRKALKCYEMDLKHIYNTYATICNTEPVEFKPILIRLYLWQFYFDCDIHDRGLTLVEIDKLFHHNRNWLSRSPHNPFETIYFWQFVHSLITVASRLYAKRQLPDIKPDTILANAFRTFMDDDVLPRIGTKRGHLVNGVGLYIPLKGTYKLYRELGEPHTVRAFLCAVRHPPHDTDKPVVELVDTIDDMLPLGHNAYMFGDEMSFIIDDAYLEIDETNYSEIYRLKLFNFANVPTKTVIKIFAKIFPGLCHKDNILNLDIEITFLEFFEAFISCAEESIRIRDAEKSSFTLTTDKMENKKPS